MLGLAVPAAAAPDDGQWDPTLPKVLSAGAPGDPVAIANASFQATQMAIQTTQSLGQQFLQSIGLGGSRGRQHRKRRRRPGPRTTGDRVRDPARRLADGRAVFMGRRHAQRAQHGRGVRTRASSATTAPGFTRYAFAGVGVLIPKYSGDQYNTGRKVPPSQAKRGDLLVLGARRQPARRDLSRRRQDARGVGQCGQGDRQPGAHRRACSRISRGSSNPERGLSGR